MEKKFYPENFESYLKRQADQFKMAPSKKVWHGIYNNIHPGTRWPSVTISLVFILALVVIGHLNSNNNYYSGQHQAQFAFLNKAAQGKNKISSVAGNNHPLTPANNANQDPIEQSGIGDNTDQSLQTNSIQNSPSSKSASSLRTSVKQDIITNYVNTIENSSADNIKKDLIWSLPDESEGNFSRNADEKNIDLFIDNRPKDNMHSAQMNSYKQSVGSVSPKRIKKHNAEWTYYLTPSLSYRSFSGDQFNTTVTHTPFIGLEGGAVVGYRLSGQLQFLIGAQVNYSAYNIKADNIHPRSSTLILNSNGTVYSYSGMSNYGNQLGNADVRLKNYSLQASLPLGLQYVFSGNSNIKFGAVATFQPLFVITNQAYLLSSDGKNYLMDKDLLRTWNMSTNIGAFISFTSNSFKWQIGPQIHYQLLSTYTDDYPIKEHFINYGIRVGISKILK